MSGSADYQAASDQLPMTIIASSAKAIHIGVMLGLVASWIWRLCIVIMGRSMSIRFMIQL